MVSSHAFSHDGSWLARRRTSRIGHSTVDLLHLAGGVGGVQIEGLRIDTPVWSFRSSWFACLCWVPDHTLFVCIAEPETRIVAQRNHHAHAAQINDNQMLDSFCWADDAYLAMHIPFLLTSIDHEASIDMMSVHSPALDIAAELGEAGRACGKSIRHIAWSAGRPAFTSEYSSGYVVCHAKHTHAMKLFESGE